MKKVMLGLLVFVLMLTACTQTTDTTDKKNDVVVDDSDSKDSNQDTLDDSENDSSTSVSASIIEVQSVSASIDDGNVPENTIDGYRDTRWSANGDGVYITFDFGSEKTVESIAISFYKGDIRYTDFTIKTSDDLTTWHELFRGNNSDHPTTDLVLYDVNPTTARYVRLYGYGYEYLDGSKSGEWTSILEVQFYNSDNVELEQLVESEVPDDNVLYTYPGFLDNDGIQRERHIDNPVTGSTITVSGFSEDAIQLAINRASVGDEVFLPRGLYQLREHITMKSGVNLRGEEGTILQLIKDGDEFDSSVIDIVGLHDIMLSDFTITSDFIGTYSTDHTRNNPHAAGPKYGVKITDNGMHEPSYNITVDNLLIENFVRMGVRLASSHDVIIRHTTFQKATDLGAGGAGYGISIQGEGNNINRLGYLNDSRYNIVENCHFIGPYIRHGVVVQYYSHNNLITNNTFTNSKLDAIDLHGEDEYLNEVSYNTVTDVLTGGAVGVGNSGATHDASGADNYIHHNTISNCREGIRVYLGSPNTLIEYNTFRDTSISNAKGIYIQHAPGTMISNNTFVDNNGSNFYGIYISKDNGTDGRGVGIAKNVTIEDNTFTNQHGGIYISAGTSIAMTNNTYDTVTIEVKDVR